MCGPKLGDTKLTVPQNASLVDILYLFDSGALIDFTTDELVNLIRALFADSEKRDKAIERVERGPQLGAASEVP